MKRCGSCGVVQPVGNFCNNQLEKDGLSRRCSDCRVDKHLRIRYGITLKQYKKMLKAQKGRCKICGGKPGIRRLAVDHNHKCCPGKRSCGKCLRGLLCTPCNVDLAVVENREWVVLAEAYIEEYE